MKTKTSHCAPRSSSPLSQRSANRTLSILNNNCTIFGSNCIDSLHIGDPAKRVNRDNCLDLLRAQTRLERIRAHVKGVRLDINKNWLCATEDNDINCCRPGVSRHCYPITWSNSNRE